ncbi:sensor domain-containing diguanylate cyclase [Sporosarcina sp. NCCP-2716]|uniref:sensor domain-containing diguanylate cyclase n=1 Tax=Sporosarcina sp. NCCP-2716 TaxID=2943679 RepID=UPI00203DC9E8|nr:sensor domain-containing diguanylate cyclase [Sporosarcina sp. NCCP-2716]
MVTFLRKVFGRRSEPVPERRDDVQERNFEGLLENSKDVIYHFQIEPEWKFIYLSPAMDLYLGEGTVEAALSDPSVPFELVHPDDLEEMMRKVNDGIDYGEMIIQRWRDRDGNYHWFEERMTPIYEDGRMVALQGVTRNIDERMERQRQLEYQANYDSLTGVHNRTYFDSLFRRYDQKIDTEAGLILCDVDKLKQLNDLLGHVAGDDLLKRTARFLEETVDGGAEIARIGGDEFTLLLTGDGARQRTSQLADRLGEALDAYNGMQRGQKIHMSLGVAGVASSAGMMAELFREADDDMYRNKFGKRLAAGK